MEDVEVYRSQRSQTRATVRVGSGVLLLRGVILGRCLAEFSQKVLQNL